MLFSFLKKMTAVLAFVGLAVIEEGRKGAKHGGSGKFGDA
jgi:hypothetical protein